MDEMNKGMEGAIDFLTMIKLRGRGVVSRNICSMVDSSNIYESFPMINCLYARPCL